MEECISMKASLGLHWVLIAAAGLGGCDRAPRTTANNPARKPAATAPAGKPRAGGEIPAKNRERVVATFNRGVGLMEQIRPSEAVAAFEEVVRLAPDWPIGHVNLGIALLNSEVKDNFARAEAELRAVIEVEPQNCHAHYALGMLLSHLARFDEAKKQFEAVLAVDPEDADSHYHLGFLLAGTDRKAARRHLEIALAKVPHHESACYRLHVLLRQMGESEKAQQLLARFQELKQAKVGITAAMKYGEMGRYAGVVRAFASVHETAAAGLPRFEDVAATVGLSATNAGKSGWPGQGDAALGPGVAVADVDADGDLDICLPVVGQDSKDVLLLNDGGRFTASADSGIDGSDAISAWFGDYDRDGDPDLYLTCTGPNRLYRNDGKGRFTDVTELTGTAGGALVSVGAAWADADHDGDLDLYVCNRAPSVSDTAEPGKAANQLFRNNGDGTFKDVAAAAGIDAAGAESMSVMFIDLDNDRDLDLLLLNLKGPNRVFLNDRLGRYSDAGRRFKLLAEASPALAAVAADLDGNGRDDLLVLRDQQPPTVLMQTDSGFRQDEALAAQLRAPGGAVGALVADLNLDGTMDLVLLSAGSGEKTSHLLLAGRGGGRFDDPLPALTPALSPGEREDAGPPAARGAVAADFDGDGGLELLVARAGERPELWRAAPPKGVHWLEVIPSKSTDLKPGEPQPNPIGVRVEVMSGQRMQAATVQSSSGYLSCPPPRVHFGLGSKGKADYVRLSWPDANFQSALEIAANQHWQVSKQPKKASSCPVLFSWDGRRFAFVTDFLGGGGLGFWIGPNRYAAPDPTEDVRIDPRLIQPKDGKYLLRITEPLEEATYLDLAQLVVYDHPAGWEVYPDERFGGQPPLASGRPLAVARRVPPLAARNERGEDVLAHIANRDRRSVEPPADPRFAGYAADHWLELDFGTVEPREADRWILYLHGWVEYTYSHANYAAHQAGLSLRSPSIEVPDGRGGWRTAIADIGFPAGLPRMMTCDVTELVRDGQTRFRIRTNMLVFWDEVFLAREASGGRLATHRLNASLAELRPLGYPREFSPDGAEPTEYDYQRIDRSLAFKNLSGSLTRFGDVRPLLGKVDDQMVVMGRGEEIALEFDAARLPPLPAGWARTVVLSVDGYCKDMDLYTAYPDTIEPLPYRAMDNYPPSRPRRADAAYDAYRRTWNTRHVPGK
jgi:hypothetical protein